MNKRTQKKSANKTKKILAAVAWILAAVIVLGVVGVYSYVNSGAVARNTVAAKTENFKVTTAMMTYLYNNIYQNYMQSMSSYGNSSTMSGLIPDTSKPLDQQNYYSGQTWHDYFLEETRHQLEDALVLAEAAVAAGYKLSDDDKADIDETLSFLKTNAESQGVSVKTYIKTIYGNAVDEATIRQCLEILKLAENYSSDLVDSYSFTEEDWNNHFKEHEEDFLKIDYLTFTFEVSETDDKKSDKKETDTTSDADTEDADSDDSKEADSEDKDDEEEPPVEATYAEELSNVEAEEGKTKADAFKAYVKKYLTEVKYKDMTEEELEEDEIDIDKLVENCLVEASKVDTDSEDEFTKWASDAARDPYETKVIKSSDKTKYMVYMILPAAEDDLEGENYTIKYRETYTLKNFRYIPVALDSSNTDTKAAMAAAKEEAQAILDEFNKNASEDGFAKLADEHGDGSVEGGLIENAEKGIINDEASEWLFAEGRKAGECTIVESEGYGCYILYYVGDGDQCWQGDADTALKTEQYESEVKVFEETHKVTFYKKGVNLVKSV
ncbi:MAG: hypothetical protein IJ389_00155 [Clostridia bacterium]|nr:hypothetical protein [Clostridia bacterium]